MDPPTRPSIGSGQAQGKLTSGSCRNGEPEIKEVVRRNEEPRFAPFCELFQRF